MNVKRYKDICIRRVPEARACEVAGNCVSLGVTIDGKDAKVFTKDVKAGVYAGQL